MVLHHTAKATYLVPVITPITRSDALGIGRCLPPPLTGFLGKDPEVSISIKNSKMIIIEPGVVPYRIHTEQLQLIESAGNSGYFIAVMS